MHAQLISQKHLLPTKDDNLDKTDVDDGETGSLEIEDIALDLRSESIQTKIRAARACRYNKTNVQLLLGL